MSDRSHLENMRTMARSKVREWLIVVQHDLTSASVAFETAVASGDCARMRTYLEPLYNLFLSLGLNDAVALCRPAISNDLTVFGDRRFIERVLTAAAEAAVFLKDQPEMQVHLAT